MISKHVSTSKRFSWPQCTASSRNRLDAFFRMLTCFRGMYPRRLTLNLSWRGHDYIRKQVIFQYLSIKNHPPLAERAGDDLLGYSIMAVQKSFAICG